MREELKKLKEISIDREAIKNGIENYLKNRFKTIREIDVTERWVSISTEYYSFVLWSNGSIEESKRCPTSIPNTMEEILKMGEDLRVQRQEALTALYYIKFRR